MHVLKILVPVSTVDVAAIVGVVVYSKRVKMRRVEVTLNLGDHWCLDLLAHIQVPVISHEPLVVRNVLHAAFKVAKTGLVVTIK